MYTHFKVLRAALGCTASQRAANATRTLLSRIGKSSMHACNVYARTRKETNVAACVCTHAKDQNVAASRRAQPNQERDRRIFARPHVHFAQRGWYMRTKKGGDVPPRCAATAEARGRNSLLRLRRWEIIRTGWPPREQEAAGLEDLNAKWTHLRGTHLDCVFPTSKRATQFAYT